LALWVSFLEKIQAFEQLLTSPKGSGIGRETASAFASAGASKIVLLGRKETPLAETKAALSPAVTSSLHAVSITDEEAMKKVAASVGTWDILIIYAAYLSSPGSIVDSSVDEMWKSYEVCRFAFAQS
jgi:NADP-dependent 3-hydroxy acid dehydrogenase YdfG